MPAIRYVIILALTLQLFHSSVHAELQWKPREPSYSYATMSVEHLSGSGIATGNFDAESSFQAWWSYVSFPGISVATRKIFLAAEIDGMDRRLVYQGERINGMTMTRIGIFGGTVLWKGAKHRGALMAGTGVASDFISLHRDAAYLHLIYNHRFTVSKRLQWGLGVLVMCNSGRWQQNPPFNLLPSCKWTITPTTFLSVNWDNAQLKQYVSKRVALVGDVRYDFSFFRLDNDISTEFETVAAGGGVDVWVVNDIYVRLRYKQLVYRNEYLGQDGTVLVNENVAGGRAIKLLLVYAR